MTSYHQSPGATAYSFGPFRFVPQRQSLHCDGQPVRIGGRALDILTLLVRRAGEPVSKNELLTFCWPSTYVHEDNLKVNVATLRKILADGSDEPFIATVPGRGYRFVGNVNIAEMEAPRPESLPTQALPPLQLENVIGRADELKHLSDAISRSKCVTIVGPGGMGKTTMALAVAHHVQSRYAQGVSFIDLSAVGDAQYVTAAIAAGVGAKQRSEDTLLEIMAVLYDKHTLLILDNCEHLTPTVQSVVDRLLRALPKVTILATSREPLGLVEEELYRLPNLAIPGPKEGCTASDAMRFAAVRLFVSRAAARAPFDLTDDQAPTASAICRRLDGIPLAIEMVANKATTYGLKNLDELLEQRLLSLSNGERTAPLRHQTMLATLDWSYRLLSDDEAAFLRSLSVFAGLFRLPDVSAIAAANGLDPLKAHGLVERLIDKSLIYVSSQHGERNLRLLESTRAFAMERLRDAGEHSEVHRLHARRVLALFEEATEALENSDKELWMGEYAHRINDARNAMNWAFGQGGDQMIGIRLTASLIPLWNELSSLSEMQSRVERSLLAAREIAHCPKELTMKLIAARASGMTFAQHLPLETEKAWKECYSLGVESKDKKYQIFGLWGLCSFLIFNGRPREGIERLQEFVALTEAESDSTAVDEATRMIATAEIYIGETASARSKLEHLAAKNRRMSDPVRFARFQAERGVAVRCTLSLALWASGEVSLANQVALAAVERAEISGHVVSHFTALAVFAVPVSFWSGEYDFTSRFLEAIDIIGQREDLGMWREACAFYACALRAKRGELHAATEMIVKLKELVSRNVLRAPMHYCMTADALLAAGELEEARTHIEQAEKLAFEQDANWCLPEILRVSALIDLEDGQLEKAERLLRQAIARAVKIGGRALQLRAELSLSQKFEREGQSTTALKLLRSACSNFSAAETFPELIDARKRVEVLERSLVELAAVR